MQECCLSHSLLLLNNGDYLKRIYYDMLQVVHDSLGGCASIKVQIMGYGKLLVTVITIGREQWLSNGFK